MVSWDDHYACEPSDPKSEGYAERMYERDDHDRKAAREGTLRDRSQTPHLPPLLSDLVAVWERLSVVQRAELVRTAEAMLR